MFFAFLFVYNRTLPRTYTIPADSHYSLPRRFGLARGTMFSYEFKFDDSARYNLGDDDQWDVNKLAGFTDCFALDPQVHSARIGWRWNLAESPQKGVEILAYVDPGHRAQHLGFLPIGAVGHATIALADSRHYAFRFNDGSAVKMIRDCPATHHNKISGVVLYPYFGGNHFAPHRLNIKMNNLLTKTMIIDRE
ncbi:MAG: hypothetical protein JWM96_75 [Alphaproteobacteria bacterium]|nr:hypothetical protein [Alphaproteobacteria bacterium]